MSTTPWYTSDKLIEAVKRKILFPISQNTFTEDDILAFANEEMFIAQVPAVMQYHEEYFVYRVQVPLVTNISRYSIPDRAIGMKLRDLFWSDQSGNYFEMTRISSGDKAFFQRNIGANQAIHKFYMENNDILLTPSVVGDPSGKLNFFIFLRPNQLVRDSRARPFTAFTQDIVLSSNPIAGDKFVISLNNQSNSPTVYTFEAGVDFAIGATIEDTTSNLTTAINAASIINTNAIRVEVNPPLDNSLRKIVISYKDITASFTSLPEELPLPLVATDAFSIESLIGFKTQENYTDLFGVGDLVDFLQTKPGHRTYAYDITVKAVGSRLEGTTSVPYFKVTKTDLYTYYSNGFNFQPAIANIQIGDYVCVANECIIPQIPPDLHNSLAERTAARILAAIGDTEGLQAANAKLQEIEVRQGSLLDDRSEGTPQKITARHSLLRYGKMGTRKRM
jgi:hypothetical protein